MKTSTRKFNKKLLSVAVATLLLTACSAAPTKPEGADNARNKLAQLQADPQLASRAPVAIKDAELAVRSAEEPRDDDDMEQGKHLVYLADRKVDIASAQAQSRLLEDQRKTLSAQREGARLDSRTREVDLAHMQTDDLKRQLEELNAKETERGLVVTPGDLLFATGKSELKGGEARHLSKLAIFLNKYQDRSVIIEGHTDNVGSENSNHSLSQRRADSVRSYLVSQGIASNRLVSSGMGEGSPIAGNDSSSGRQENRRVEVVIANTTTSSL